MMTPRPDHFSYPIARVASEAIEIPEAWQRSLFLGTILGCFGLALALLGPWA